MSTFKLCHINRPGGGCYVCGGVICGKDDATRCVCADRIAEMMTREECAELMEAFSSPPAWHSRLPAGVSPEEVEEDLKAREP